MLELMKKLEQVQELDLMIDKIMRAKAAFPARLAQFETEINTRTTKRSDLTKRIEDLNRIENQHRGALELNESRSKRSQERLAAVKSSDEFQALNKEIESLKKSTLAIQEAQTKVKDDAKKLEADILVIDAALTEVQAKLAAEQAKINDETGGVEKNHEELVGKRRKVISGVEPRYLAAYDKIRGQKTDGVGIVPVIVGVCKGCNMKIMPQLFVEIQRMQDLHTCPSCRRMLLYMPSASA